MCILIAFLVAVSKIDFNYADICADINYACDSCLGNSFGCVWCADEVHNDTRCRLARSPMVTPSWCQNIIPEFPDTELPNITFIRNENYRPKSKEASAIQLKPQHVVIKARPNNAIEFTMSYKPTLDHPIDVRCFFDNSEVAKLFQKIFEAQESKIFHALKEISGDVRFRLSSLNMKDVNDSKNVNNSKNYLNTLLETLKDTTWMDDARKIIVLFCNPSDTIHNANSSEIIHVNNRYVRKINQIATEKRINIIFTGLEEFQEEYKALAENIRGATYVELKNIAAVEGDVDLANVIKNEYVKMVHTLELEYVGVLPAQLSLSVKPACEQFGRRCVYKTTPGTALSMLVTLEMFNCPRTYKYKDTVTIKTIGSHENLTIDTDILCYCECAVAETNSPKCNSMGDYKCGICNCYQNRYGKSCQCIGDAIEDGWQKCRSGPDDFYRNGCNDHGDCICGVCHCNYGYAGEHCTREMSVSTLLQTDEITKMPAKQPGEAV